MKAQIKKPEQIENGYFLTDSDEPLEFIPLETVERINYSDFDLPRPRDQFDENRDWYFTAFDFH